MITIYLYDPSEAERLGFPGETGGFANPFTQTVRVVYGGTALAAHELAHVIAEQSWGRSHTRLMSEGLAVAIKGRYGGVGLSEWRTDTVAEGGLASIGGLLDREDDVPERYFYPQAGSFVRFLLDRNGRARLAAIYNPTADALRAAIRDVYGLSLADLEREYHAALGAP